MQGGLRGRLPVHDTLVQIRRAQAPGPAAERDVVAVVDLGQVVEAARLLGERQDVGAAAVRDLDVALLDVDVGRAVLAHRPELDEVDRGVDVGDGIDEVQRAHDVVDLGVDRVLAVDHGVGGAALLGEVDDGIGAEAAHHVVDEGLFGQIADEHVESLARHLLPAVDPPVQRGDRDERVNPHFEVVAPPGEVVRDAHLVAGPGKMQCRRPAQIPVTPEDQNSHRTPSVSVTSEFHLRDVRSFPPQAGILLRIP